MRFLAAASLCLVAAAAAASPPPQQRLLVGLKQRGLAELEAAFWAVAEPSDPAFGQHLSRARIRDIVAPAPAAEARARAWLAREFAAWPQGAVEVETLPAGDSLRVTLRFLEHAQTQTQAQTQAQTQTQTQTQTRLARPPAAPAALADVVDFVILLHEGEGSGGEGDGDGDGSSSYPAELNVTASSSTTTRAHARARGGARGSNGDGAAAGGSMGLAAQKAAYGVPAAAAATQPAASNLQMVWGTGTFGCVRNYSRLLATD
jgi:hypothetical protein